jgi:NAD(P)-dependent dehydrogenase (short-subunit alcohol dehydrogenase family)
MRTQTHEVNAPARVALITGGTDGIGKATARVLLRGGWRVVVTGRNPGKCEATVAELEAAVPGAAVSALVGDLGRMADVARVAAEFRARNDRLDALLLNANTITQTHTMTPDGFEANLALGYLGRALLAWHLEDRLGQTPGAQVLTVVGLNLQRLDFDAPSTAAGFSSMKALGRWQWAMQVFARAWNAPSATPMNVYMPGLVRTKILAEEPQPMRLIVQIANLLVGVRVDRAGKELAGVVERVATSGARDAYFARTKLEPRRNLREQTGDGERLWALTERLLAPWRAV